MVLAKAPCQPTLMYPFVILIGCHAPSIPFHSRPFPSATKVTRLVYSICLLLLLLLLILLLAASLAFSAGFDLFSGCRTR